MKQGGETGHFECDSLTVQGCYWIHHHRRDHVVAKGRCCHNPLLDPVEGDLDLTPEQLGEIEIATRAKDRSYAKAYGQEKRANPTAKWKAMQKAKNAKAYPQTRANQLKAIAEKTSTMPPLDISGGQRKDVALGANPAEKVSETLLTLPPMRNDLVTSRK
ncbi:unnamed protein product [Alternaria alternata]